MRRNKRVEKLWWDMSVPFEAMKCLDKNGYAYNRILNALKDRQILTGVISRPPLRLIEHMINAVGCKSNNMVVVQNLQILSSQAWAVSNDEAPLSLMNIPILRKFFSVFGQMKMSSLPVLHSCDH